MTRDEKTVRGRPAYPFQPIRMPATRAGEHGVDTSDGIESCDVEHADLDLVRACVTWCVRGDRFCDGCLGARARNGFLNRCLTRLKELDEG